MTKLEVWQDVEILPCPPDLVECPACAGRGCTCRWMNFEASPVTCELCGGEGEVTPELAAEWEHERLEELQEPPIVRTDTAWTRWGIVE